MNLNDLERKLAEKILTEANATDDPNERFHKVTEYALLIRAVNERGEALASHMNLDHRADESALGPQGPQSLDAKLFIGGKEVQPIDPGKAHDFRAFETSGEGIGAYHYCSICGNHKSHPLHRPAEVQNIPALFGGSVKE